MTTVPSSKQMKKHDYIDVGAGQSKGNRGTRGVDMEHTVHASGVGILESDGENALRSDRRAACRGAHTLHTHPRTCIQLHTPADTHTHTHTHTHTQTNNHAAQ
jgi:hypothetical protein